MEFNIRGENFEVTQSLSDYVQNKVSKLTKYFNETPDTTANVKMTVFQGVHKVEVTVPMKGLLLRAEEDHLDMYAAVDLVLEKLERQVRKFKTKTKRRPRQLKHKISELPDFAVLHEEDEEYEVVRVKRFSLKPMFEDEAIMQMELLGHSFFVFTNAASDKTEVVYRRKNGQYGLITSS